MHEHAHKFLLDAAIAVIFKYPNRKSDKHQLQNQMFRFQDHKSKIPTDTKKQRKTIISLYSMYTSGSMKS